MTLPNIPILDFLPTAPDFKLDWEGLHEAFEWVRRMQACPQDPTWHAEGNVWIHTRMVLQALCTLPSFRGLPAYERALVFAGALLHDVAKPDCTRSEPDGRITSRGHSRRGAILTRKLLWQMDAPFAFREHVAQMVAHHQVPYLLDRSEHAEHTAISMSQLLRCDLLATVTLADAMGRTCQDKQKIVDSVWYFEQLCKDAGVWDRAHRFESDHARFLFARDRKRTRHTPAFDDTRLTVTMLSGLPGAGKNHWLSQHGAGLPVVALDDIRDELNIHAGDKQGAVIQQAYQRAKVHLRAAQPFVWNATNVGRDIRKRVIDLLTDYKARVRVVYVEVPYQLQRQQNRERKATVPQRAMDRILARWSVPTLLEAHEIQYVGVDPSAAGA